MKTKLIAAAMVGFAIAAQAGVSPASAAAKKPVVAKTVVHHGTFCC